MIFEAGFLAVSVFALVALGRVLIGPHIADRLVAFSTVNTLVIAIMFLAGAAYNSVVYVDVAIVYCALSLVGSLFFARYLEGCA